MRSPKIIYTKRFEVGTSHPMKSKIIAIFLIGTFASETALCTNPSVLFLSALAMIYVGIAPDMGDCEHYGPQSCGNNTILCVDSCKVRRIETYHFANDTSECEKNRCVRGALCIQVGKEINVRNAFHPDRPYLGTTWGWALAASGVVLAVTAIVWSWVVLAKGCFGLPDYLQTHRCMWIPELGDFHIFKIRPRGILG